jgi:hypothetical protein
MSRKTYLAEHVAVDRGFGWSDTQTLTEDTTEVGGSAAVPKQTTVAGNLGVLALVKSLKLSLALDAEDVLNFILNGVGHAAGLVEVLIDLGEF